MRVAVFLCAALGGLLLMWPTAGRAAGFALVVGVNDCPQFELPGGARPRPLKGAERDAEEFAALLIDEFGFARDQVLLIKGAEATLANLSARFSEVAQRVRRADRFVFYFAGHGTQALDRRPFDEPDGLDEALCLHDSTADGQNLLLDDELGRRLDALTAGSVTVVLDCCHAGTGAKEFDDEVMPRFLPTAALKKQAVAEEPWRDLRSADKTFGRTAAALFACRPGQRAYERRISAVGGPVRAGQFTCYLLEGLRKKVADAKGDGILTNEEAAAYAARRIDETFNRRHDNIADRQQPTVESDLSNARVFGYVAAEQTLSWFGSEAAGCFFKWQNPHVRFILHLRRPDRPLPNSA